MAKSYVHVSVQVITGVAIVYDLSRRTLVHDITDYSIFLHQKKGRSPLTTRNIALRLVRFWLYLDSKGKHPRDVNDSMLAAYRDHELKTVEMDRSYRGSVRSTKATVNQRIGTVLGWLVWMQEEKRLLDGTIGPSGCAVTAIAAKRKHAHEPMVGEAVSSPLFLRGAGNSGIRPSIKQPVYESAVCEIMREVPNAYIAERNALLLDIARHTGFRLGSICSLRIDQFDFEVLCKWTEPTIEIRPSVQKLGYSNEFNIPLTLALRVCEFIQGARQDLVQQLRVSELIACRKIFLSSKTGAPMTNRGMSQSLRPSMRAAGAPKGKVVHAVRGLFAQEAIKAEALHRRDAGLDTSAKSIAVAVAWKLGQKNWESLFPYVADELSRLSVAELAAETEAR